MTLLVTGATGWLGLHVVEYLAGSQRMLLVARRGEHESAYARLASLLRGRALQALGSGDIRVLERDLSEDFGPLTEPLDGVVHLAARTDFRSRNVADYRPTNVGGALRAAELAAHASCPLLLASTAYVAGDHPGTFRQQDIDVGQRPNNAYERSKLEAELAVRAYATEHEIPLTVVRPGIVLPDRPRAGLKTGPGPLVHMELLAGLEGRCGERTHDLRLEADPAGLLNLVPLDRVVRAVSALALRTCARDCTHHLTAPRSFTVAEIQSAGQACLEGLRVHLVERLDDPDRYERLLARRAGVYRPYYGLSGRFEPSLLMRDLGLGAATQEAWLERVFSQHIEAWRERGGPASSGPTDVPSNLQMVCLVDDVRAYLTGYLAGMCGRPLVPGLETLCADFTVTVPGAGSHRLRIVNGVLSEVQEVAGPSTNFDYSITAEDFLVVASGQARPSELFFDRRVSVRGDLFQALATATALEDFFQLYPYRASSGQEHIA